LRRFSLNLDGDDSQIIPFRLPLATNVRFWKKNSGRPPLAQLFAIRTLKLHPELKNKPSQLASIMRRDPAFREIRPKAVTSALSKLPVSVKIAWEKILTAEIPADYVKRALEFYRSVFNWELNPVLGVEYIRLLTIRVDDKVSSQRPFAVNGAIVERNAEVRGPVVTISVADMDETLERISKLGGSVVMGKNEFGKSGYTAYFNDTEGNVTGLWQIRAKS
jgi:uncharacterized protein